MYSCIYYQDSIMTRFGHISFYLSYFSFYILNNFLYSHNVIITPNKINTDCLVSSNSQFMFKLPHLPKTNSSWGCVQIRTPRSFIPSLSILIFIFIADFSIIWKPTQIFTTFKHTRTHAHSHTHRYLLLLTTLLLSLHSQPSLAKKKSVFAYLLFLHATKLINYYVLSLWKSLRKQNQTLLLITPNIFSCPFVIFTTCPFLFSYSYPMATNNLNCHYR